jgi:hypothetical protein
MGWFEERDKRKRRVVVLPTRETYYKKYDLYLTLEMYWQFMVSEYNTYVLHEADEYYRPMDFSEWLSLEWYRHIEHNPKWTDEDYAKTRPYRLWKAAHETAVEQANDFSGAMRYSDRIPVITWPDRRRNMVRTFKKKTGEK